MLLIFSCQMNEVKYGKITYYSWHSSQLYFKITSRRQKYGGFLLNYSLIVLHWKSQLWVDFKIESVFIITSASLEKENKISYIATKKWEQLQLTLNYSKSEEGQGEY